MMGEDLNESYGKEKIVREGNSFYEIDLECVQRKEKRREGMEKKRGMEEKKNR